MSPRGSPSTPSRRIHGNDEVGSHALNPLTPQRSGERLYARQVENRASGGAVSGGRSVAPWPLAVPAPVVTRTTERQEESSPPPPPCTQLLDESLLFCFFKSAPALWAACVGACSCLPSHGLSDKCI
jgi:hypothetical protein